VRALDRNLEPRIGVLAQSVSERVAGETKLAIFVASVGAVALLLTAIGIYGVVSFFVAQRTMEIGVRMALGARAADVLWLVLSRGLRLVLWGTLVGLGAALAVTRALTSLLFDVKPSDPMTLVGVSLLLAAVTLLACYIPARRAAKVDPVVALRYE
jgi:putative ABC transport system permease protein